MGHIITHNNLAHPFFNIEEWVTSIPAGQLIASMDGTFHLILLLEGEFILEIPGYPEMRLAKGDAYSLSFPTKRILRSPYSDHDMQLHFLRLQFRFPATQALPYRKPTGSLEKRFVATVRQRLSGFQYYPHSVFGDNFPIVRCILSEMETQDEVSAWKISGLCQTLVAGLLSASQEQAQRKPPRPRHRGGTAVEHALQYLQENCHKTLTLDSIAWQVQLSGNHLGRIFRESTGRTVFEWLDHFRTEKARNLLLTTEWPLSRIAKASGYSSASLLSRHFKKKTGHAPMEFRLKSLEREIFSPSNLSPREVRHFRA